MSNDTKDGIVLRAFEQSALLEALRMACGVMDCTGTLSYANSVYASLRHVLGVAVEVRIITAPSALDELYAKMAKEAA
jgi:hypothetical protein